MSKKLSPTQEWALEQLRKDGKLEVSTWGGKPWSGTKGISIATLNALVKAGVVTKTYGVRNSWIFRAKEMGR